MFSSEANWLLISDKVDIGLADTDTDMEAGAEGKEADRVEGEARDMSRVTEEEADPEEGRKKEAVGVESVRCVWLVVEVESVWTLLVAGIVSERVFARWA